MTYIPGISKTRSWKALQKHDVALLVFILSLTLIFLYFVIQESGHAFDFQALFPYIVHENTQGELVSGLLLQGFYGTLRLGLWALFFSLAIGGGVGILSAHKKGFAALPFKIYIQFFRNMPPLILLFFIFFFASSLFTEQLIQVEASISKQSPLVQNFFYTFIAPQGQLDRMVAAIITLALYEGAYVAEIVRSGIESIPQAQWEAALSQGFSLWQCRHYIIAPQSLRIMLPPLLGQSINVFKNSALASIISVPELTFQTIEIMAVSQITLELWICVIALYFILARCLETYGNYLEKHRKWTN